MNELELEDIPQIEPMVLFVGDKPSKNNTNPKIAFKGTRSGKVLEMWAAALDLVPDAYITINRVDPYFTDCAISFYKCQKAIIALGAEADKALTKFGIPHYTLPHPSGRNRVLNDKNELTRLLGGCKSYIVAHEMFRE